MFPLLLVIHAIIAAVLVTFVLLQKSEGGGLGMGGSPSGLMSARGAADFLTRGTAFTATAFIAMSILLAFLAASRHNEAIDTSLAKRATAPAAVRAPTIDPGGAPPVARHHPPAPPPNAPPPAAPPDNAAVPLAR